MFQSIRNIFAIKDLRDRILFTLMCLAIYRIGSFIPLPFISQQHIAEVFGGSGLTGGIFGVVDMFTGGSFSRLTLTSLGIMPYISASIILQLMMIVVPRLEKIAKEGESGRKKINQFTRYGTVLLSLVQGFGLGLYVLTNPKLITASMQDSRALFLFATMVSVTAGTVFLMWLGERIGERGIGNGISLLITMGIIARYPAGVRMMFQEVELETQPAIWLILTAGICVAATIAIVLIQEGARKIPIQHAKQMVGRRMQTSQTNYLPLKVNTAGVMPVIFSSAILTLPSTIFGWIGARPGGQMGFIGQLFASNSMYNAYDLMGLEAGAAFMLLKAINLHTLLFILLTGFFCFFYTAIVFNPQDVADNLRRVGAFVPGYRPGKQTADYIDRVMTRITFVGAVFLCAVSIVPQIMGQAFSLSFAWTEFMGGTGLIIVVAVVLDTMKQIESRMLLRHYEGFKTRRQSSGGKRWASKEQRT